MVLNSENSRRFIVRCACGRTYRVSSDAVGKKAKCACGRFFTIVGTPKSMEQDLRSLGKQPLTKTTIEDAKIRFKCWVCSSDMESLASEVGNKQQCSECKTMNVVPQKTVENVKGHAIQCFYCKEGQAAFSSGQQLTINLRIKNPTFTCPDCGETRYRVVREKNSAKTPTNTPYCLKCESKRMIPDNLPPMPLGLYYTGFRSIGIIQNEDGSDGLTLSGRVWLPRCSKCEIRQNKINMVAGILSIIVVIACFIGLIFGTDLSSASGVKDAIIFSCLSPLIIFFTFAASRGVLARIAGAQGIHRLYKEFPPVAKLLENGWVL